LKPALASEEPFLTTDELEGLSPFSQAQDFMVRDLRLTPQALRFRLLRRLRGQYESDN